MSSKLITESVLMGVNNDFISSSQIQGISEGGLGNTKEVELVDVNSNFYDNQNNAIVKLEDQLGSVDYSDDDLEVDRDEETRGAGAICHRLCSFASRRCNTDTTVA